MTGKGNEPRQAIANSLQEWQRKEPIVTSQKFDSKNKFDPKNIEKLDRPERAQWQSITAFLEILRPQSGMTYADIGCGPGYFTLPVAERVGPKGQVYAVDLQPEMLSELAQRAEAGGLKNIKTVRCEERRIPLPDDAVEAACLANVYHELEDTPAFLAELRRILRPGGRLILIDWKPIETPMGPPLSQRIPGEIIGQALQQAGFAHRQDHDIYPYHTLIEAS
ncbi:MAG TPA: methyltransferase domain-containing protein [Candidatus Fraserbacteria bacterium]|nr:methyltransferase domain-containing protein [Candidatus Fraserbacteria bacterium]